MLEQMLENFELSKQQLKELDARKMTNIHDSIKRNTGMPQRRQYHGSLQEVGSRRTTTRECFLCGGEVHWKRGCPLNFSKSAPTVDRLARKEVVHQNC